MDKTEETVKLFKNGLNCSQALLAVFGESFGVSLESAKTMGRHLGGGIGRLGLTCGAVTGAIMVLAHAQDETLPEGEARERIAVSTREFIRDFEERHGTTLCRELLGEDFSTEAGLKKIKEEKLVAKLCPVFVKDAAEILSNVLAL
jgi:C_GCAxxG_C_C family probable redox protein